MADFSFNLIEDEAGSGMSIGYLHDTNHNSTLVAQQRALILWELLMSITEQKSCVIVWWGPSQACSVVGSRIVHAPDEARTMETVFWKGFRRREEFISDFVFIWNASTGVQIYPTEFREQIPDTVTSHFFDTRDKKRAGMDYSEQHRPVLDARQGLFGNLRSVFSLVWTFEKRLRDVHFRAELMNPFLSVRDAEVVQELGLYVRKAGDGSYLELLTTSPDISNLLRAIFEKHTVSCVFRNERRTTWG